MREPRVPRQRSSARRDRPAAFRRRPQGFRQSRSGRIALIRKPASGWASALATQEASAGATPGDRSPHKRAVPPSAQGRRSETGLGHNQPRRRGPDARARMKGGLDPRVATHLLIAKSTTGSSGHAGSVSPRPGCRAQGAPVDGDGSLVLLSMQVRLIPRRPTRSDGTGGNATDRPAGARRASPRRAGLPRAQHWQRRAVTVCQLRSRGRRQTGESGVVRVSRSSGSGCA